MDYLLDHHARDQMTPELAHHVMQTHKECPITACAVKLQAKTFLVHTKRLVPQSTPRTRFGF
ncbi:hypothetical protein [Nocardia pseudovaccinii]|uniref:hypothetical protein n=1 Tax=Nocardia pseudovaccinii TaxID=189540 RepID=UPI0007A48DAD|nr:hypothetical protein [Nocardia pseudovaccinii]